MAHCGRGRPCRPGAGLLCPTRSTPPRRVTSVSFRTCPSPRFLRRHPPRGSPPDVRILVFPNSPPSRLLWALLTCLPRRSTPPREHSSPPKHSASFFSVARDTTQRRRYLLFPAVKSVFCLLLYLILMVCCCAWEVGRAP